MTTLRNTYIEIEKCKLEFFVPSSRGSWTEPACGAEWEYSFSSVVLEDLEEFSLDIEGLPEVGYDFEFDYFLFDPMKEVEGADCTCSACLLASPVLLGDGSWLLYVDGMGQGQGWAPTQSLKGRE